jgi:hypothetical protein
MTGFKSKKDMAQAKLPCQCSMTTRLVGSGCQYCNPEYLYDDDAQPAQESQIKTTDPFESARVADYNRGWNDCIFASGIVRQSTAPQRPWVGLTEDELVQIGVATGLERAAVEMISNKLKEKNT